MTSLFPGIDPDPRPDPPEGAVARGASPSGWPRSRPPVRLMRGALAQLSAKEMAAALRPEQLEAVMHGKRLRVPRLEAWWGARPYAFGGRMVHPRRGDWPRELVEAMGAVERATGKRFDSVFCNVYRSGEDCISWHADDDDWIGPWIASLSLGSPRRFLMRRKRREHGEGSWEWELRHGDVLLMGPGCQQEWEHSVPRTKLRVGPRLNLTFRQTVPG